MKFSKILLVLIFGLLIAGGIFSIPKIAGNKSASAQFSQAISGSLPNFFTGVDWFQVLANILNPQSSATPNICKIDLQDVITTDDTYVLKWSCGGSEAPCTIYANGKVFSQVHGAGSAHFTINQPAVFYTIRNNKNLPCNYQIAHQFQSTGGVGSSGGGGTAVEASSITTVTYATPTTFQTDLEAYLAQWDGSSLATSTIVSLEIAASTTMRTAIDDILSATSDGVLTTTEENTISTDSAALTALGHGYEIVKVSLTSTDDTLIWIRDNDGTFDTDGTAIFRVSGYGTITGGGKSQQLVIETPHRNDDTNTIKYAAREFLVLKKARVFISTHFNRDRINATGTGTASSLASLIAGASCTGIEGRGGLIANDKGLYYINNEAGGSVNDYIYFVPYSSGPTCPPIAILHDEVGTPRFDGGVDLDFVNSRRIIAADIGLEEFWCQDLDSNGEASGSPIVSTFTNNSFNADLIATTPTGNYLFVIDDPDPNATANDSQILRFSIDSGCNLSGQTTIASSRGEIDGMKVDAFGNLIFVEDDTAQNRADVKYINNAQGGGTTIATLMKGTDSAIPDFITLDDITSDSLTISSPGADGHGDGNILIYEAGSDQIFTIVVNRDSSHNITGFGRIEVSNFQDLSSNTVRGMAIQPGTSHGTPETLWVMNRNSSSLGSIYYLTFYNNEIPIIDNDSKNAPKLVSYQTMTTELARQLNVITWQVHGYSPSGYPAMPIVCGSIHPIATSDGFSSTTSKSARGGTFSYLEAALTTAWTGYSGCADSVDFSIIAPNEQITPELTASTNKQCDEICVINSAIGYDLNDDFFHTEFPTEMRVGSTLNVSGTDISNRFHTFVDGL